MAPSPAANAPAPATVPPAAAATQRALPHNVFLPRDPLTGQIDMSVLEPSEPPVEPKPAPARSGRGAKPAPR